MMDIVSIVIAVISLIGTILSAGIAGWVTFYSDERKRRRESEKLISKYREPLVLAAYDFQSRLYNIIDQGLLCWSNGSDEEKENLERYTCFVVGQFLSWEHILRRQAQFVCFETHQKNRTFVHFLDMINGAFSLGGEDLSRPFRLYRAQQLAIGEIMTIKEGDELYCMGYAEFDNKWNKEPAFKAWFQPLMHSLHIMSKEYSKKGPPIPDHRLRRLQHLLIGLIRTLDPKGLRVDTSRNRPCSAAKQCPCWEGDCADPVKGKVEA